MLEVFEEVCLLEGPPLLIFAQHPNRDFFADESLAGSNVFHEEDLAW